MEESYSRSDIDGVIDSGGRLEEKPGIGTSGETQGQPCSENDGRSRRLRSMTEKLSKTSEVVNAVGVDVEFEGG